MKVIIKRTDGGVTIMSQGDVPSDLNNEIRKWSEITGLEAESIDFVDDAVIPVDRTYRNAWGHNLEVDIDKAKEIQKQILRGLRLPLLQKLDTEFIIALGSNNTKAQTEIEARKVELRNITDSVSIENSTTVEELKEAGMEIINYEN